MLSLTCPLSEYTKSLPTLFAPDVEEFGLSKTIRQDFAHIHAIQGHEKLWDQLNRKEQSKLGVPKHAAGIRLHFAMAKVDQSVAGGRFMG